MGQSGQLARGDEAQGAKWICSPLGNPISRELVGGEGAFDNHLEPPSVAAPLRCRAAQLAAGTISDGSMPLDTPSLSKPNFLG